MTLTWLHVLLLWGQMARQAGAAFQLPPFLQTLSEQTLSKGQATGADRVFKLPSSLVNVPNIRRFTPRKKHLKPHKLRKRLRKDWDPFWMSAERPQDMEQEEMREAPADPTLVKALHRLDFTLRGAEGEREEEASGVSREMDEEVRKVLEAWLLQRAACHVRYVWDDLGILYWPRYVRRGYCQATSTPSSSSFTSSSITSSSSVNDDSSSSSTISSSCSWPPGMHCVPAESRRIRILRWSCRHNKAFNNWSRRHRAFRASRRRREREREGEGDSESGREKREAQDSPRNQTTEETNETENWSRQPFKERRRKLSMRCKWKKIPYPVTDDCYCSC